MPKYRRNFLKQVLARVDFTNPIDEIDQTIPEALQSAAIEHFPILEPSKDAFISGRGGPAVPLVEKRMWEFFARDRRRKFRITDGFMVIEDNRYADFGELQTPFDKILSQVFLRYSNLTVQRLGLRYIDEIQLPGPPLEWSGYINKNLLSILEVPESKDSVVRAFSNLEMRKEQCTVRFQYGVWNPDYPSPLMRKNFILDTDVSCTGHLSLSDVRELLPVFHDEAARIFENSIEDGLREVLNASENEPG